MAKRPPSRSPRSRGGPAGGPLPIVWLNRVRTLVSLPRQKVLEEALRTAYGPMGEVLAIVVCDKLSGYSTTNRPDVLSVELIKADRSVPKFVKIGDVKTLRSELAAWKQVSPYLESPDPWFVSLVDRSPPQPELAVLEYDDANRVLSTSEVASLEEVVRRSCRWGSPPSATVAQMIRRIFDYIDRKLVVHARPVSDRQLVRYYQEKLKKPIQIWWNDRVPLRRPILLRWGGRPDEFQDPVDWLNWLLSPAGQGKRPECIFGPCHGDVNGRNILIGLVRGEAADAAVYDFEDMAPNLPVAWDFAKLEVELKVRILGDAIRSGNRRNDYLGVAMKFERLLNQWTGKLDREAVQPEKLPVRFSNSKPVDHAAPRGTSADQTSPDKESSDRNCPYEACPYETSLDETYPGGWLRLFEILLEIRRCARRSLSGRERSERWKDEYSFALAAYAVNTARYKTYGPVEQELAYIIGGVAAANVGAKAR